MIAEAELDALVIAAPTTAHVPLALAAIERGIAVLVEKPLAATVDGGAADRGRRRGGRASRSRSATSSGSTRPSSSSAACSGAGWLSRRSTRSPAAAPGRSRPHPRRRRDRRPRDPRRRHPVAGSPASGRPRVYAETAQRIHAEHEDLLFGLLQFPSGATGMLDVNWLTPAKRRQLVVVGEEGMFELDYLTQRLTFTRATDTTNPRLIGGYAPTFEGEVAELPVARPSRWRPSSTPSSRSSGPAAGRSSTSRTACGPSPSRRPARRGRRRPGHRPDRAVLEVRDHMTIVTRPSSVRSLLGGSIELPPQPCRHAVVDRGLAVGRRARDGRHGRGRRGRQDGPAAVRPVRRPRLVASSPSTSSRRSSTRSTPGSATSPRSRASTSSSGTPMPRAGSGRRPMAPRPPARRRRRPHRPGHARRRAAARLPLHGRGRRRHRARDPRGSTVIFETTLPVGDTRERFTPRPRGGAAA